jgi:hypothetical protein
LCGGGGLAGGFPGSSMGGSFGSFGGSLTGGFLSACSLFRPDRRLSWVSEDRVFKAAVKFPSQKANSYSYRRPFLSASRKRPIFLIFDGMFKNLPFRHSNPHRVALPR